MTSTPGPCSNRALAVVILAAGWISSEAAHASPSLAIDERVEARRAIERVYWSHRTWPAGNPGEKPTLEQVLPDDAIRREVEDTLRKSRAIDGLWGRSVTTAQLQAELERMARQSESPTMLGEIFAALGHSPVLAAEVLARPLLVDRVFRLRYAWDDRFHSAVRAVAEGGRTSLASGTEGAVTTDRIVESTWLRVVEPGPEAGSSSDPSLVRLQEDEWAEGIDWLASAFGVAVWHESDGAMARVEPTAILDDLPVGVWSPLRESDDAFYAVRVSDRAPDRIHVTTSTWQKTPFDVWWETQREQWNADPPALDGSLSLPALAGSECAPDSWRGVAGPPEAVGGTVVWTGSEMIVWGGTFFGSANTGRRYDPATDTWRPVTTRGAPAPRTSHVAVWTGSEMVVWGGYVIGESVSGGRYDPLTDTWRPTSTGDGVPTARWSPVAVWTGSEMLVWGGRDVQSSSTFLSTGARYDPVADRWTPMRDAPGGRVNVCFVWTGTELLVWGGVTSPGVITNTGLRYSPADDFWLSMPTGGAPAARSLPSAVWTGRYMIVWGGYGASQPLNSGAYFDPAFHIWTATPLSGAPTSRWLHTAVWDGNRMFVWGGRAFNGNDLNTGALLDPVSRVWTPTSTGSYVPSARERADGVWTGSEVLVWGGGTTDGARFDSDGNRWLPIAGRSGPEPRYLHTAVWTGAEMIAWGGNVRLGRTNTGGIYDPATDSWSPTSLTSGVPTARVSHTAVWTGREMIVWGGSSGSVGRERTGGRYDPTLDTWRPTSVYSRTPEGRERHTAIWTGTEMLVWGGRGYTGSYISSGGRFDPQLDTWQAIPTTEALEGRVDHSAVSTGSEMVVWGGVQTTGEATNSGGRYSPATNSWSDTSALAEMPSARGAHTAVWTGNEMLVWGGGASGALYDDGARYDPDADEWRAVVSAGTASARARHTAVWTGDEMIVWGGSDGPGAYPNAGGSYDPDTDGWRPTAVDDATPDGRLYHTAVWTGSEMIVWGGLQSASMGRYCPCDAPTTWYRDRDGDGFGDEGAREVSCAVPEGYVAVSGDCNDEDGQTYPGAAELCDLVDNDCDGDFDESADASCDDGTACTTDRCQAGDCVQEPIACEDGNSCTNDTCDPLLGCGFDVNGTCDHSPKGQGYWRRICAKPHVSGDFVTEIDVDCVGRTLTFSTLGDPADICARLDPDPPNDKCAQAEAQFLALELNLCRYRLAPSDRIQSECGGGETVGASAAMIDEILSSTVRDHATCAIAQCMADEIDSGAALQTDSLRLGKQGIGYRLTWAVPYAPERGAPRLYRVSKRAPGETSFAVLGETAELFWDLPEDGVDAEFDVGFVW